MKPRICICCGGTIGDCEEEEVAAQPRVNLNMCLSCENLDVEAELEEEAEGRIQPIAAGTPESKPVDHSPGYYHKVA